MKREKEKLQHIILTLTLLTMLYFTVAIVIPLGIGNNREKYKHLKIHLMIR